MARGRGQLDGWAARTSAANGSKGRVGSGTMRTRAAPWSAGHSGVQMRLPTSRKAVCAERTRVSGMIESGHPDDSELLRRVMLPKGSDEVMPAIGNPIPRHEIALLRRWIRQGAEWPEQFEVGTHWAYIAPRRPATPPVTRDDWGSSPIDAFVLKRLEDAGLNPAARAKPETLVRRLYLDLLGLPPSPAQVDAFLNDPSDKRIEHLVERQSTLRR